MIEAEQAEFEAGQAEGQKEATVAIKRNKYALIDKVQAYSNPESQAMKDLERIADNSDFYGQGYTAGYNKTIIEHLKKILIFKIRR